MDVEIIKGMYKITMILNALFLILTFAFKVFNVYEEISLVFLPVFVIIGFININERKNILACEVLDFSSMILIATTLIVCISYAMCVLFIIGRETFLLLLT